MHQVVRVDGGGGRLPDTDVANDGRRKDQVPTDSRKVEWRNGQNESFERSELCSVPDSGRVGRRLLGVELLDILDTESEEIRQLGSGIDLCLPCILSLTKHRGGHELVSVFTRDEVSSLEEDGGLVVPWHVFPFAFGGEGACDGVVENRGGGAVDGAEVVGMVMREGLLDDVAGSNLGRGQLGVSENRRIRRTSLPSITHGTSKGISPCILSNAA